MSRADRHACYFVAVAAVGLMAASIIESPLSIAIAFGMLVVALLTTSWLKPPAKP